jgi:membrane-associated phospholipid phosphatase
MEQLLSYDRQLFRHINLDWQNGFFDWMMPWLRNSNLWAPLYLFLFLLVIFNYPKNAFWWIFFGIATAALTDYVSSNLIKHNIIRIRPCNEPSIADWVRVLVGYRPQSSSFTSSHAATHFGMATFLYFTLRDRFKKWPMVFFLWAFLISYAQVYVGVHYPLDIICGGLIGILIGYLSAKAFRHQFSLT